ncbi:MAG: 23S rRNA (guanosine(2251)-2'-O)-methyltransferase RlmB [Malacoplasma sp.]|nr:23S rRNA (guanosine(2251)-2'-O)-methyltransferase RlmB [Malacoplasma sp.]
MNLFGKKALLDQIKSNKNQIVLVHLLVNNKELISYCDKLNIHTKVYHDRKFFDQFSNVNHQDVVIELKDKKVKVKDLDSFIKATKDQKQVLVLMLDSIHDPHNFGAILRTADAFGVDAVIYKKNNQVGLTDTVAKTSMGAVNTLNLIEVVNLSNAINVFKENKFWIYASTLSDKTQDLNKVKFDDRSVIIVGNEENGISPLVIKNSDFNIKIPMFGNMQSLNVSVATGILLYYIKTNMSK